MFIPGHRVYAIPGSMIPSTIHEHPAGSVTLTHNGIPVHTSQPDPVSRRVQVLNTCMVQSYHQSASVLPLHMAARTSADVSNVEFSRGIETMFSPAHRLNAKNGVPVGVGVCVGVGVGVTVGVSVGVGVGVAVGVSVGV